MKVREFITMEEDIDVYDDVCEELGIAFCGPIRMTAEGEKEFADVLDYEITMYPKYYEAIVHVDGDDWEKHLKRAKRFFYGAAGYIADDLFNKWFIL